MKYLTANSSHNNLTRGERKARTMSQDQKDHEPRPKQIPKKKPGDYINELSNTITLHSSSFDITANMSLVCSKSAQCQ